MLGRSPDAVAGMVRATIRRQAGMKLGMQIFQSTSSGLRGVSISAIDAGSVAEEAGLKVGEVVVMVEVRIIRSKKKCQERKDTCICPPPLSLAREPSSRRVHGSSSMRGAGWRTVAPARALSWHYYVTA